MNSTGGLKRPPDPTRDWLKIKTATSAGEALTPLGVPGKPTLFGGPFTGYAINRPACVLENIKSD